MLELHQFKPRLGVLNASPFCMKVELYLKMAEVDYRVVDEDVPNGPKGKLPYISDVGKKIGDSSDIIEYLKETRGDPLDAELTSEQRAKGLALRRMLEEHTYFVMLYLRWLDPDGWPTVRKAFFSHLPLPLSLVLPAYLRLSMRKTLQAQGIGRHSREEVIARGQADIQALAALLGEGPYVVGESPTSFDACVYAFLANMVAPTPEMPLTAEVVAHERLVAYCARMKERYLS